MSDDQFRIRWKGKILGPFTRREIDRKMKEHELGMLHEIWIGGQWISLKEFLHSKPAAVSSRAESSAGEENLPKDDESPASDSDAPSPWLFSGYISVLFLFFLALLGWSKTWTAPWGWAPLLGLGLGLIGGLAGLLTLFQGEKKHGLSIIGLSILLAFGNMLLS